MCLTEKQSQFHHSLFHGYPFQRSRQRFIYDDEGVEFQRHTRVHTVSLDVPGDLEPSRDFVHERRWMALDTELDFLACYLGWLGEGHRQARLGLTSMQ